MSGSAARYLDTSGRGTLGVGICDRCGTKRSLTEFMSDPNTPGLKVCRDPGEGCIDKYDPYRLPARSPDRIQLPFNRPDQRLDSGPDVTEWLDDETDWLRAG
jgi:hypothetical protein